jgi:hypothetical protein
MNGLPLAAVRNCRITRSGQPRRVGLGQHGSTSPRRARGVDRPEHSAGRGGHPGQLRDQGRYQRPHVPSTYTTSRPKFLNPRGRL